MIYGYIRVSTDKQTVENQRFDIEKFCEKNEINIDKWVTETVSGTKFVKDREVGKLLGFLEKDDILICSELSRLGRNMLMIMSILNTCMEKQAQVWTIKDNYRLGKDIPSQVLAFAFGLSAQIERDLISQRTKQALDRLKANGVKLGRRIGSGKYKPKLIGKEEEIIKMVNQGYSKKEIAYRFDVSPQSIWSFLKEKSPAHILKRRQNERD